uniref:Uncharacterized protein n=1 Tax=Rhizophora mucronata TaxID=61149 RepID=A0A2P2NL63_RHIMU
MCRNVILRIADYDHLMRK